MDAGSVLDNLLERHRDFVAAPEHTTLAKVHRRHGSTSSAVPPSKMVEAVERGVNPLMLGVQAHKAESAAREKAKARRKGSELDASYRSLELPARPRTASSSPRKASNQSINSSTSAVTVLKTHTQLPAVPAAREMQRAREVAISATLTSRYQELRAKRQQEDEERKHGRSDTASALHSAATGAGSEGETSAHKRVRTEEKRLPPRGLPLQMTTSTTVSRTRRGVWRRRCTTRKILRLAREISRASALRRYWYTALSDDRAGTGDCGNFAPATHAADDSGRDENKEGAATAAPASKATPTPTPEQLGRCTPPLSLFASNDTTEKRCALRRLRAARRSVNDAHDSPQMSRKRCDVVEGAKAAAATPETVQLPVATAQSAAHRTTPSRTSRRQRKEAIRCVLSSSAASMWALAARIVAERLGTVSQLRLECMATTAPASGLAARRKGAGMLPLSLARLFPLFGALVEVQELELTTAPVRLRSSRNTRRARFASAAGGESVRGAPELRVLQERRGVVVEEYSETLGVLLLPPQCGADMQAWTDEVTRGLAQGQDTLTCASRGDEAAPLPHVNSSPSIVRVPKHFPGASGSFSELLQRLLLRTPTTPATPLAGLRVLVAVFCGEVHTAAEGCDIAARHVHRDEEGLPVPAEGMRADAYPLHRLLHRCL